MNNIQKSIVGASLMGTMFSQYDAGELNNAGELVRKRVSKYMKQRFKTNFKDYISAVEVTDEIWRDALKHFAKENMRIEAKSTIMEIYNYFENELTKYANITSKHIENMMIQATDDAEAEFNSGKVIDYIIERLGLPVRKNNFHTRFTILKQNRIIEGKVA